MTSIALEFDSEKELYVDYMPFLKNGGIFYRTLDEYDIGTELIVEITLPDALESSQVTGKVCWLTPPGCQNGTPAGIGISFEDDPEKVRHQIETLISRMLSSAESTSTM